MTARGFVILSEGAEALSEAKGKDLWIGAIKAGKQWLLRFVILRFAQDLWPAFVQQT